LIITFSDRPQLQEDAGKRFVEKLLTARTQGGSKLSWIYAKERKIDLPPFICSWDFAKSCGNSRLLFGILVSSQRY
jgi:hypothetical protein